MGTYWKEQDSMMISDQLDLGETWSSQHKKEIEQDLSCTCSVLLMVELEGDLLRFSQHEL